MVMIQKVTSSKSERGGSNLSIGRTSQRSRMAVAIRVAPRAPGSCVACHRGRGSRFVAPRSSTGSELPSQTPDPPKGLPRRASSLERTE
jgi:hypothetical protein